ncbi:MAG: DUF6838 family protein [Eubacteriales bacterium]
MLSYQQISSEISRLLAQAYPDYGVYANALPQGAQYPCFLIQSIATDMSRCILFFGFHYRIHYVVLYHCR